MRCVASPTGRAAPQAGAGDCLQLLTAEAVRRGVDGGRGAAAPLRTQCELYYNLTDAEMEEQLDALAAEAARQANERHARLLARPPSGSRHSTVGIVGTLGSKKATLQVPAV